MKKILVIGATSSIAQATSKIWATEGAELFLVGRNAEQLDVISKDMKIRGASKALIYPMDANDFDLHLPMLNAAFESLQNIDVVLIAHGTLSDQKKCEQLVGLTINEIKTNGLSVIALLTQLAIRLESQGSGTIAVLSSVAGDRGRQSNYVYGSAKSMVSTFLSGLRQRLNKSGVNILTVKPGFVDTPMTASIKKGVAWVTPDRVAQDIHKAILRKKSVLYTPQFWLYIMLVVNHIPEMIFKKLKI